MTLLFSQFFPITITTVKEPIINHTYTSPRNNYTVTLKVIDNNTLWNTTTKTVVVCYRTDLNKDGKVNIEDIFILAKAFGRKIGEEKYDARADVNEDGYVNIYDVFEIAKDYGKTV